ncbi:DUF4920 domain-containing protein [Arenimonas aestuarii]
MNRLLLLPLLSLAPLALAADYGAPMPAGDSVSIAEAAAKPEAYEGKPGKFSGRITEVCQKKGCWVVLEQDGHSARVMARDHGFEVPKDASGTAVAYGVLEVEPISAEHARHLVEDDGARAPAKQELRIVATTISLPDA